MKLSLPPDSPAHDRPGEFLPPKETPRSIKIEIFIVFAITLGAAGLRSLVSLIDSALQPTPLAGQSVSIVVPLARASYLDMTRQLIDIVSKTSWGLLGLYLLWRAGIRFSQHLGLDLRKPWSDTAKAVGLAAVIGIPGLVFYVVAYRAGLNLDVVPTALKDVWWSGPVLILAAIENGFLEEVLVVGYLLTRLRQLNVNPWVALAASALLRGSYHLYQGFGGFAGNVLMGLVFGYAYLRWRRLGPLIVAHSLIDIVAFVGYALAGDWFNGFLR